MTRLPPRRAGTASLGLLLGLLVPTSAGAQTTWIVDASGGGNFTQIQPALNAAASGDTILVRAGNYPEFIIDTSTGVMIAGEPGVVFGGAGGVFFTVSNLPAGETFTMRNISFTAGASSLQFIDCAGQVYLEEMDTFLATVSNQFGIHNCAQISLTQVDVHGLPGMTVSGNTNAVFVNCNLRATAWITGWPALTISGANVTIVDSTLSSNAALGAGTEAIQMTSGTLTLAGRNTTVRSGTAPTPEEISAVQTGVGQVFVDPAVFMTTQGGAPPVGGGATVTNGPIVSVHADGLASLGTWLIDVHAPTGSPFCLFVSKPAPAVATPFGATWLDLGANVVLACGNIGPGNQFSISIPLVAELPRAVPVVAQALAILPGGAQFSTPSVDIIE